MCPILIPLSYWWDYSWSTHWCIHCVWLNQSHYQVPSPAPCMWLPPPLQIPWDNFVHSGFFHPLPTSSALPLGAGSVGWGQQSRAEHWAAWLLPIYISCSSLWMGSCPNMEQNVGSWRDQNSLPRKMICNLFWSGLDPCTCLAELIHTWRGQTKWSLIFLENTDWFPHLQQTEAKRMVCGHHIGNKGWSCLVAVTHTLQ